MYVNTLRCFFKILEKRPNLKKPLVIVHDLFAFQQLAEKSWESLYSEWNYHCPATEKSLLNWRDQIAELWNPTICACLNLYAHLIKENGSKMNVLNNINFYFVVDLFKRRWIDIFDQKFLFYFYNGFDINSKITLYDSNSGLYIKELDTLKHTISQSTIDILKRDSKNIFEFSDKFLNQIDNIVPRSTVFY